MTSTSRDPWQAVPLAACGAAAGIASFLFLTDLARATGWGHASPLLPLTVDALAVASWRAWATRRGGVFALACGVLATALSVAGNAVSHAYSTGHSQPGIVAVTVVASIPAVAVALVVHMSRPAPAAAEAEATTTAPTTAPARRARHSATPRVTPQGTAPATPTAPPVAEPDMTWPDPVLAAWCADRGATTVRPIRSLGVPDKRARTVARLAKEVAA